LGCEEDQYIQFLGEPGDHDLKAQGTALHPQLNSYGSATPLIWPVGVSNCRNIRLRLRSSTAKAIAALVAILIEY